MLPVPVSAQMNTDGGRSELPGMKQDMFDRAQRQKRGGEQRMGRGPPECPKSDKMSPFWGLAFVSGEVFIKVNSSSDKCSKLLSVGGANYTQLTNASRTCGPAGEVKKRIAEDLSAVFFQGGFDWVKHDGETIEVITEDGTFEAIVSEEKWAEQSQCWARGCECEQAKNPVGKAILLTLLAIAVGGVMFDSLKLSYEKFKGKKPPKHVECRRGHRVEEVKFTRTHYCDICGKQGINYQCSVSCPYDLCKDCYKGAKKKMKDALQAWYDKHPEEKAKDEEKKKEKKKKKDGTSEAEDSDGDKSNKDGKAESEADSTTKAESEAEGGKESKADSSKPDEETDKEAKEGEAAGEES